MSGVTAGTFFPRATRAIAESNQEKLGNDWNWHQVHSKQFLGVSFMGECKLIFHEIDCLKAKKGR